MFTPYLYGALQVTPYPLDMGVFYLLPLLEELHIGWPMGMSGVVDFSFRGGWGSLGNSHRLSTLVIHSRVEFPRDVIVDVHVFTTISLPPLVPPF